MNNFETQKKNFLSKPDKSSAKAIDKKIFELVNLINASKNYYTNSSCAGRILLIKTKNFDKKEKIWIFKKHEEVSWKEALKALKNAKSDIWLIEEGPILHVTCKNFRAANFLLKIFRNFGFKKSGIIAFSTYPIVELAFPNRISLPIAKNGKLLLNKNYFKILIDDCNKKLKKEFKFLKKIYNFLKTKNLNIIPLLSKKKNGI